MPINLDPHESYAYADISRATSLNATTSDRTISVNGISTTNSDLLTSTDIDAIFNYTTTAPDYLGSISSAYLGYRIYLEAALRNSVRKCLSAEDHKKLILQIVDIYNEVLGHDCVSGDYVKFEFDEDEFNKILGEE